MWMKNAVPREEPEREPRVETWVAALLGIDVERLPIQRKRALPKLALLVGVFILLQLRQITEQGLMASIWELCIA
jgi:hypothetical protein